MNNVTSSSLPIVDQGTTVRPTEAQLRWAQFHHKRRAGNVKKSVELFWMLPEHVNNVAEAQSDDGNTTEESKPSSLPANIRLGKPKISRGRRALLRVSKRRYQQRRQDIQQYGFRCGNQHVESSDDDDEIDDLAIIFAEESFLKKRRRRRKRVGTEEMGRIERFEAAFHSMMMTLAAAQGNNQEEFIATRIWTRPVEADDIDYEDLKYWGKTNAKIHQQMLIGMKKQNDELATTMYADGLGGNMEATRTPVRTGSTFEEIVNRLQKTITSGMVDSDDYPECPVTVPPRMRLSKYFCTSEEKKDDEAVQKKLDFNKAATVGFVRKRVPTVVSPLVQSILKQLDTELLKQLDSVEPGLSEQLLACCLEETDFNPDDGIEAAKEHLELYAKTYLRGWSPKMSPSPMFGHNHSFNASTPMTNNSHCEVLSPVESVRLDSDESEPVTPGVLTVTDAASGLLSEDNNVPFEASVKDVSNVSKLKPELFELADANSSPVLPSKNETRQSLGFVKRFVSRMELAAEREELITVDGKLHRPTFGRLVRQYLNEAMDKRSSKPDSNAAGKQSPRITEIIESLIAKMANSFDDQAFVDPRGHLNVRVFESMVSRYLAEASGVSQNDVSVAASLLELDHGSAGLPAEQEERNSTEDDKLYGISRSFITDLVRLVEKSCNLGTLVSVDGKLDKPAFAQLITQYLTEATLRPTSNLNEAPSPSLRVMERLVKQVETSFDSEPCINSSGRLDAAAFQALVSRYLDQVIENSVSETDEATSCSNLKTPRVSQAFVKQFVFQMERAADVDPVIGADGKINHKRFERLVIGYIEQAKPQSDQDFMASVRSPLVLARALQNAKKQTRRSMAPIEEPELIALRSPGVLRKFVQTVEDAAETEKLVNSNGKFEHSVFESLVTRYLDEALLRQQTENINVTSAIARDSCGIHGALVSRFVAHFMESSKTNNFMTGDKSVNKEVLVDLIDSSYCLSLSHGEDMDRKPVPNGFVERFATLLLEECRYGTVSSPSGDLDMERLNGVASLCAIEAFRTEHSSPPGGANGHLLLNASSQSSQLPLNADPESSKKLASSAASGVGGLFKNFYLQHRNGHGEIDALAAFRRTQGERPHDDSSSVSSIRVLPDGIKGVVKRLKNNDVTCKEELDDEPERTFNVIENNKASPFPFQGDVSTNMASSQNSSNISPERIRMLHEIMMAKSAMLGTNETGIIDTDESVVSGYDHDPAILKTLLLSPTILTKRLQQAIRAIENRSWDQVQYLLNANP
jgi:hypothetical protein